MILLCLFNYFFDSGVHICSDRYIDAFHNSNSFFVIGSNNSMLSIIAIASLSLVPTIRQDMGRSSLTFSIPCLKPFAMSSHRVIPPKILMRIAFTFLLEAIILSAFTTFSGLELPPMSRKLAGYPKYLIVSIVAIAKPAPFTMQAISPSKDM